jgi:hypothetical protein
MADEISRFLKVPLWDAFAGESKPDPDQDVSDGSPPSRLAVGLAWVARMGYLAAGMAAVSCIIYSLQQGRLNELEAELRPVRARLVATEVKEWIAGNDDWSAFGTFEVLSDDEQGRATGDLIPQGFYESRGLRGHGGEYSSIPRNEAEKFLASWEIGRVYDGYVYPDTKDHIFFKLPGAAQNALNVRRLAIAGAILLTLGLIASAGVGYVRRNTTRC